MFRAFFFLIAVSVVKQFWNWTQIWEKCLYVEDQGRGYQVIHIFVELMITYILLFSPVFFFLFCYSQSVENWRCKHFQFTFGSAVVCGLWVLRKVVLRAERCHSILPLNLNAKYYFSGKLFPWGCFCVYILKIVFIVILEYMRSINYKICCYKELNTLILFLQQVFFILMEKN